MAIKENALPVSQSIGSGDYLRKVSSGGVSQQVPFSEVKAAVVTVDPAIDSDSENPVQNKAIAAALDAAGTQTQQAIATAIQTEVADRNSAISQAISTEVSNRNTAISEAVAAETQSREAADDELNQSKANTDGNYPDMTVGNADQLISSIYTGDQTPYNFRQSGGGLSIGDREIDKIVGGTIAWNQLAIKPSSTDWATETGATATYDDGVATVSSTTAGNGIYQREYVPSVKGHKYLAGLSVKGASGQTVALSVASTGIAKNFFPTTDNWERFDSVLSNETTNTTRLYAFVRDTTYENVQFKNIQVIDLTAMFGSAIADYIYSLEQATAGAGVAYFRKLFPKPYYAYNAGELMSVQAVSHEMFGFNQWDEEWELGTLDNSGNDYASSTRIRSKGYTPVLPSTTYYLKSSLSTQLFFYDANKVFISAQFKSDATFKTPQNACYLRFAFNANYGTPYKNDICINLSHNGSRNGEYAPYEKHSYELDSGLTLRGIPKLDASNNLYYDGDEYESDGSVNRRYVVVDLGTLNWMRYNDSGGYFGVAPSNLSPQAKPSSANVTANIIVSKDYTAYPTNSVYGSSAIDMTIGIHSNGALILQNMAYTDADALKATLSGVMLAYELATPTEESAAPYTNPQTVSDWGTEEYVDAAVQEGDRDVAVPVGHVTDYLANLRDKLQNLPDAANADGTYLVQQTSGQMALLAYTPGVNIPAAPTTDGTYTLQAVVSGGVATYSWVSS